MIVYQDKGTGLYKIGKSGTPEYNSASEARRAYQEKQLQTIRKNLANIRKI